MRMARKLGLVNQAGFAVLRPGSWEYAYNGQEQSWDIAISPIPGDTYTASSPVIDENGSHVFANSGRFNEVVVACTGGTIDLTPFTAIRVKYSKWVNCGINFMAAIEFQPASSSTYLPYPIAGGFRPQMSNDLIITHVNDSGPGEFVINIPDSAKSVARRVWIKVPKNYYYGDASVMIDRITFEK